MSCFLLLLVSLFSLPVMRAAPVGCMHDGSEYNVGDKVVIDCDECVCQPGTEN